jgi:signal transduction histidine kinase
MPKVTFIVLLCLLRISSGFSQNSYCDSLRAWLLAHPKPDSIRVVNLHRLSHRLSEIDTKESWRFAYEANSTAKAIECNTCIGQSLINFAILEGNDANYVKSQEHYVNAIKLFEQTNWKRGLAICYNNMGKNLLEMKNYDKSAFYVQKALVINQELKQARGQANNFEVIGQAYLLKGDYDKSIQYLYEGLTIAKTQADAYLPMAEILRDIAENYVAKKQFPLAFNYFDQAVSICQKQQEKFTLIQCYTRIAKAYQIKKNFAEANQYLSKALQIAKEANYTKALSEIYEAQSDNYQQEGKPNEALLAFKKHAVIQDSLKEQRNTARLELMQLQYDSYLQEKENLQLKKIREEQTAELKQKSIWIVLISIAFLGAMLGGGYLLYRNRIREIQKVQQAQAETIKQMQLSEVMRNRIARDLHDDVGSTLSSISILSQIALNQQTANGETTDLLGKISRNSQRMLDSMLDIVWTTKPINDNLDSVSVKMREFAAEVFEAQGINYEVVVDEKLSGKKLPDNQQYNFYLIFKEAINNIAKYSEAKKVSVKMFYQDQTLRLEITDNGKGFEPSTVKGAGNGLKNMERRAMELDGTLNITSKVGKGTKVLLELPYQLA